MDAYEAGAEAYAEGLDISANPHDPRDPNHVNWATGWYAAQAEEDEDEE